MGKPKLSLYGSAIRTHVWRDIYAMLSRDGIDIELIFAGPSVPDFPLPSNFIHIPTNVKPAQCAEIARRRCSGDYIIYTTDDLVFVPGTLRAMLQYLEEHKEEKVAVAVMYRDRGEVVSKGWYQLFNVHNPRSTVVGVAAMMAKKVSDEIGGIDRNFISIGWDLDRLLRLYRLGGRLQLLTDLFIFENQSHGLWHIDEQLGHHDITYLRNLYGIDGLDVRRRPVEEFEEEGMLEFSQGPNGHWA